MSVILCDGCAVGVANDDWTHLDAGDEEQAEDTYARVHANMERLGWLSLVGGADAPGYFDCELCWETQCGGGYTFECEPGGEA